MDDDAHEERFRQHEAIMAGLARMLEAQHEFNRQQVVLNQQQREINADVRTTLARIETLLTRWTRPEENGRDA
jgi:hypothetical protein